MQCHEGNFEAAADLEAVPLAGPLCIQHQHRKSATDGAATSALGQKRTFAGVVWVVSFGSGAGIDRTATLSALGQKRTQALKRRNVRL